MSGGNPSVFRVSMSKRSERQKIRNIRLPVLKPRATTKYDKWTPSEVDALVRIQRTTRDPTDYATISKRLRDEDKVFRDTRAVRQKIGRLKKAARVDADVRV